MRKQSRAGSAQEKADYIRHHSGTVEIIQDFREQQYANVKVSSNDGWYSDLYKKLGKKPTIRDAEDAAYEEAYHQADAAGDTEWKEALKAAKERRDALYSLRSVIESIDTQDLAARASLSQEAYNGIYVPAVNTLKGANPEARKAAKDSALILAREADIVHALYDVPYEDAVRVILGDRAVANGYGELIVEDLNVDTLPDELNVTKITGDEFGEYGDVAELRKKVIQFYTEELQGTEVRNPIIGEIVIDGNTDIQFSGKGKREARNTSADPEKLLVTKYLREIIENANAVTDSVSEKEKHAGEHFYYLHQAAEINGEKKFVVVTVRRFLDNPKDSMKYYNHTVYSLEDYKKQQKRTPSDEDNRVTKTGPQTDGALDGHSIPEKRKVYKRNSVLNQPAWHGSPYTFDKFDLGKIGSGEGAQAHGWGLYFAADKKVSEKYKKNLSEDRAEDIVFNDESYRRLMPDNRFIKEDGTIVQGDTPLGRSLSRIFETGSIENAVSSDKENLAFWEDHLKRAQSDELTAAEKKEIEANYRGKEAFIEECEKSIRSFKEEIEILQNSKAHFGDTESRIYEADVPAVNTLLDEQKSFSRQSKGVQKSLQAAASEMGDRIPSLKGKRGHEIYEAFSNALGGDKEASLFLNEHGIKGITYEGEADGRCFVVFDDNAVSIINIYNQEANAKYAGQYSEAENLIRVFSAGNASTVVHESAHAWLSLMERLARAEGEKRGLTGTTDEILSALSSDPAVNQNIIRDLATIREWAKYSPEALAEYKGTALP